MSSEAQIRANRENGKLSQGAVTDIGRIARSRNALKHGLCGATVLLPTDRVEDYEKLVTMIFKKFNPETDPEKFVVQTIADTEWRLLRVPFLESAIFVKGRIETEHAMTDLPAEDRLGFMEADVHQIYRRELANLGLLESRLQRKLKLATAEFEKLRHEREIVQVAYRDRVMDSMLVEPLTGKPKESTTHPAVGSEFSFAFMVARLYFKKYAPQEDVAVFDRTWPDKSAKINA